MKDSGTAADWVVVRRCFRLPEAQIVKSILEAEGIDVLLPDEHMLGVEPGAETALGGARVMVRGDDIDRARATLLAMDETGNREADN